MPQYSVVPLALAALLSVPVSITAEDTAPSRTAPATGAVSGAVATRSGDAVPQLVIRLDGPSGSRALVTGAGGAFRADGLVPGAYVLASGTPGFTLEAAALDVAAGATVEVSAILEPAPVREHVVVSATRGEAATPSLGVSTTVIDADRIATRRSPDLAHLLEDAPGVSLTRAGGVGRQASMFVRGGESRFVRVQLDGIPLNEPGGLYTIGTQMPLELERVELSRGAASSLYGTDALAGVVELVTRRARPGEAASVRGEAEAGGLGWRRAAGGSSGTLGRFDWNAGAQRLETDNEGINAGFASTALAAAGGVELDPQTSLRLVARYEDSHGGTPGPTAYGRPDADASYDRQDLAAGLLVRHVTSGGFSHEWRASHARTDQLSRDPEDSGSYVPRSGDRVGAFEVFDFVSTQGYQNDTRRMTLSYQAQRPAGAHLLAAGADLEREWGSLGDPGSGIVEPDRTNVGAFAQARLVLGSRAFVTAGARLEHNGSFGTEAVPRLAVAVRVRGSEDATTLRASAGLGIKEPSFLESYGVSFFAEGNPDLRPERSRTFDLGVEQRLLGGRARLGATAFHHDYRDQIAYQVVDFQTFRGSYFNLGRTRASGLEFEAEAAPIPGLRVRAQYTLLDGEIVDSASAFDPVFAEGETLLRRPRHQGTLGLEASRGSVAAGADLRLVGRRADSDFLGLGLDENPGYARLDARVSVALGHGLEAFAVGENLLDHAYQEVLGFPALGRAIRLGLRFDGRHR